MRDSTRQQPHKVYRCYSGSDELLYIGATSSLSSRLSQHKKTKPWWPEVERIETVDYDTRDYTMIAEYQAIRVEQPKYNKIKGSSAYSALRIPVVVEVSPAVLEILETRVAQQGARARSREEALSLTLAVVARSVKQGAWKPKPRFVDYA